MPYWLCVALIPLCGIVFGALGFVAVAYVDFLGKESTKSFKEDRGKLWKPVVGGLCAAILAAGSAAEFTFPSFGKDAEAHPILTGTLTGALLAVITVLVIEALVRSLASKSWEGTLEDSWFSAVRGARRGAFDVREHLLGGKSRVEAGSLPRPRTWAARAAYRQASDLWVDLGDRVARATLAAFASDRSDLGEVMHTLATATDTLHRALKRYSRGEHSQTKGGPYAPEDIVVYWRDYVWWLLEADEAGRNEKFHSPIEEAQLRDLEAEKAGHTPTQLRPEAEV
jgi:hypothetical protein